MMFIGLWFVVIFCGLFCCWFMVCVYEYVENLVLYIRYVVVVEVNIFEF